MVPLFILPGVTIQRKADGAEIFHRIIYGAGSFITTRMANLPPLRVAFVCTMESPVHRTEKFGAEITRETGVAVPPFIMFVQAPLMVILQAWSGILT